jgi:hypothetical protein
LLFLADFDFPLLLLLFDLPLPLLSLAFDLLLEADFDLELPDFLALADLSLLPDFDLPSVLPREELFLLLAALLAEDDLDIFFLSLSPLPVFLAFVFPETVFAPAFTDFFELELLLLPAEEDEDLPPFLRQYDLTLRPFCLPLEMVYPFTQVQLVDLSQLDWLSTSLHSRAPAKPVMAKNKAASTAANISVL